MTYKLILGDCIQILRTLDAYSVQTCVTSPPYFGLRDYGVDGQIGLEETPEAYVEKLVAVFQEVKRVLKDDGTLWLNLGDSYWANRAGNGEANGVGKTALAGRTNQTRAGGRPRDDIKPKDLIGIPWMVAFALRADGWYLRSDIIWAKPNPMPESVTDRPTKSHEYMFLLSKSAKYYYNKDAIAEPSIDPESYTGRRERNAGQMNSRDPDNYKFHGSVDEDGKLKSGQTYKTRNRRDVWTVTTKPYAEAHFATFPPELITPCILAGSKAGDTVLDPFNGSGTTGLVATGHGRDYIGIELNPEYIQLAHERIGGLLSV